MAVFTWFRAQFDTDTLDIYQKSSIYRN